METSSGERLSLESTVWRGLVKFTRWGNSRDSKRALDILWLKSTPSHKLSTKQLADSIVDSTCRQFSAACISFVQDRWLSLGSSLYFLFIHSLLSKPQNQSLCFWKSIIVIWKNLGWLQQKLLVFGFRTTLINYAVHWLSTMYLSLIISNNNEHNFIGWKCI